VVRCFGRLIVILPACLLLLQMLEIDGAVDAQLSVSQSAPSDNVEILEFLDRFDASAAQTASVPRPESPNVKRVKTFGFMGELHRRRDELQLTTERDGARDTPSARGQLATLRYKDAMGPDVVQYLLGICDPDDAIARNASVNLVGAAARARRSMDVPDLVVPHRHRSNMNVDDSDDDDGDDVDLDSPQRMPLFHQSPQENTPAPSRLRFRSVPECDEQSKSCDEVEVAESTSEASRDNNGASSRPQNTSSLVSVQQANSVHDIFAAALPTSTTTSCASGDGVLALPGSVPFAKRQGSLLGSRNNRSHTKHHDDVEVPVELKGRVGKDFHLDTITANSPLESCNSPLAGIMRQCVTLFKLKERLLISHKNVRRLMTYSRRLEEGYEEGGYHCKRHAADVTNRFATILHRTGFTEAVGPYEVLSALVAAALHDYKHPQLTNNFLILQVRTALCICI
jgi:hypothetical protein